MNQQRFSQSSPEASVTQLNLHHNFYSYVNSHLTSHQTQDETHVGRPDAKIRLQPTEEVFSNNYLSEPSIQNNQDVWRGHHTQPEYIIDSRIAALDTQMSPDQQMALPKRQGQEGERAKTRKKKVKRSIKSKLKENREPRGQRKQKRHDPVQMQVGIEPYLRTNTTSSYDMDHFHNYPNSSHRYQHQAEMANLVQTTRSLKPHIIVSSERGRIQKKVSGLSPPLTPKLDFDPPSVNILQTIQTGPVLCQHGLKELQCLSCAQNYFSLSDLHPNHAVSKVSNVKPSPSTKGDSRTNQKKGLSRQVYDSRSHILASDTSCAPTHVVGLDSDVSERKIKVEKRQNNKRPILRKDDELTNTEKFLAQQREFLNEQYSNVGLKNYPPVNAYQETSPRDQGTSGLSSYVVRTNSVLSPRSLSRISDIKVSPLNTIDLPQSRDVRSRSSFLAEHKKINDAIEDNLVSKLHVYSNVYKNIKEDVKKTVAAGVSVQLLPNRDGYEEPPANYSQRTRQDRWKRDHSDFLRAEKMVQTSTTSLQQRSKTVTPKPIPTMQSKKSFTSEELGKYSRRTVEADNNQTTGYLRFVERKMKNKQKETVNSGLLIDQDGDYKEHREQDVKPAKGSGISNRREPEKPRLQLFQDDVTALMKAAAQVRQERFASQQREFSRATSPVSNSRLQEASNRTKSIENVKQYCIQKVIGQLDTRQEMFKKNSYLQQQIEASLSLEERYAQARETLYSNQSLKQSTSFSKQQSMFKTVSSKSLLQMPETRSQEFQVSSHSVPARNVQLSYSRARESTLLEMQKLRNQQAQQFDKQITLLNQSYSSSLKPPPAPLRTQSTTPQTSVQNIQAFSQVHSGYKTVEQSYDQYEPEGNFYQPNGSLFYSIQNNTDYRSSHQSLAPYNNTHQPTQNVSMTHSNYSTMDKNAYFAQYRHELEPENFKQNSYQKAIFEYKRSSRNSQQESYGDQTEEDCSEQSLEHSADSETERTYQQTTQVFSSLVSDSQRPTDSHASTPHIYQHKPQIEVYKGAPLRDSSSRMSGETRYVLPQSDEEISQKRQILSQLYHLHEQLGSREQQHRQFDQQNQWVVDRFLPEQVEQVASVFTLGGGRNMQLDQDISEQSEYLSEQQDEFEDHYQESPMEKLTSMKTSAQNTRQISQRRGYETNMSPSGTSTQREEVYSNRDSKHMTQFSQPQTHRQTVQSSTPGIEQYAKSSAPLADRFLNQMRPTFRPTSNTEALVDREQLAGFAEQMLRQNYDLMEESSALLQEVDDRLLEQRTCHPTPKNEDLQTIVEKSISHTKIPNPYSGPLGSAFSGQQLKPQTLSTSTSQNPISGRTEMKQQFSNQSLIENVAQNVYSQTKKELQQLVEMQIAQGKILAALQEKHTSKLTQTSSREEFSFQAQNQLQNLMFQMNTICTRLSDIQGQLDADKGEKVRPNSNLSHVSRLSQATAQSNSQPTPPNYVQTSGEIGRYNPFIQSTLQNVHRNSEIYYNTKASSKPTSYVQTSEDFAIDSYNALLAAQSAGQTQQIEDEQQEELEEDFLSVHQRDSKHCTETNESGNEDHFEESPNDLKNYSPKEGDKGRSSALQIEVSQHFTQRQATNQHVISEVQDEDLYSNQDTDVEENDEHDKFIPHKSATYTQHNQGYAYTNEDQKCSQQEAYYQEEQENSYRSQEEEVSLTLSQRAETFQQTQIVGSQRSQQVSNDPFCDFLAQEIEKVRAESHKQVEEIKKQYERELENLKAQVLKEKRAVQTQVSSPAVSARVSTSSRAPFTLKPKTPRTPQQMLPKSVAKHKVSTDEQTVAVEEESHIKSDSNSEVKPSTESLQILRFEKKPGDLNEAQKTYQFSLMQLKSSADRIQETTLLQNAVNNLNEPSASFFQSSETNLEPDMFGQIPFSASSQNQSQITQEGFFGRPDQAYKEPQSVNTELTSSAHASYGINLLMQKGIPAKITKALPPRQEAKTSTHSSKDHEKLYTKVHSISAHSLNSSTTQNRSIADTNKSEKLFRALQQAKDRIARLQKQSSAYQSSETKMLHVSPHVTSVQSVTSPNSDLLRTSVSKNPSFNAFQMVENSAGSQKNCLPAVSIQSSNFKETMVSSDTQLSQKEKEIQERISRIESFITSHM